MSDLPHSPSPSAAMPPVLDREQLVGLARMGHMPLLPSLHSWTAMASEDRQTLIAAVLAYGDERVRAAVVGR